MKTTTLSILSVFCILCIHMQSCKSNKQKEELYSVAKNPPNSNLQQLAFPTAEGYGKYTVGGRGGDVYEVTNLEDSGEGSFRAALEAKGPRTVVFRVSGTITGNYSIKNDNITIAGQTAPGDGICIRGNLSTSANDIIIRYIRVRWDPAMGEKDAIGSRYHKNIIFDHISASWSTDETMTLYHNENTTVQWSIIAQACPKGTTDSHRFGGIWGNNYATWHHNLIAHNASRNPRWASGSGYNDYRNNVIYNWEYASSYGGEAHQVGDRRTPPIEHSTINMIANYYKPGPATQLKVRSRIVAPSSRNGDADAGQWWVSDNFMEGSTSVTANNLLGVTKTSSAYRLDEPWSAMKINQQTAEEAYQSVLKGAGCSLPTRDKVDTDIIDDVRKGTAKYGKNGIIDSPSDVGGWPILKSTTAPIDTDHDGMPDVWEIKNKLNPKDAKDRNTIGNDGYTMLEVYLNSIK
ncbi:pectate lyase [Cellulophaga sp. F20128]|uniref:pectate lyase family protein n=1 Tax=Cellulophaga sp. F20128 TaxID=2926413 RepID=UPI001FF238D1|nr:pectate lyase [Cellulophaga sp. F20128]MCK0158304.1 pectate lyase [Cellulophaga sp. F20128]